MKKDTLTAMFAGAVGGFVFGLPLEYVTELLTFPFAHESALGQYLVGETSSILLPFYDAVGEVFGIEPFGQAVPDLPVYA